jgi:diguanylate cyclase (GGDEF)-like protein
MKINPLTGEFASSAHEAAYLDHKQAQTRSTLAFTLLFCAIFYICFTATDLVALGPGRKFSQLLGARMLVAFTAGACAFVAWRRPLTVRASRLAASVAETVTLSCFMYMAALRPDEVHWHAMSLAIMLVVVYLYIPNRLGYALALALGATAGFLVLALRVAPIPRTDVIRMSMMLALANTFGALAARRFNRVSREEYRAHTELLYAAERDHLTGCYNRRYLHDHLMGAELARAQRFGHTLTVLLCDIDNFKRINDTHGHADGDAVLRAFATLLRTMTRERIDSVVRYGGEEFLAILPETDLAGGTRLAERLRATFAATRTPMAAGKGVICATASFGVASANFGRPGERSTLRDLILAADKLMYEAKRNGRDCVEALELHD